MENKLTDNEIIKVLEEYLQKCQNIKYGARKKILVDSDFLNNVLDLINRLKSQNKEFDEKIVIQRGLIDTQKAEIERLREGNKEQKAIIEAIEDSLYPLPFETDFSVTIKKAKSEAIKEFAERLCEGRVSNDPVVIAVKTELKLMEEKTK